MRSARCNSLPLIAPYAYVVTRVPPLSISARYAPALRFGVRRWVAKSTWIRPKRRPVPAIHSKLSWLDQWK